MSRYVERLEREVEQAKDERDFLREQIDRKDKTIDSLIERDRETNILVRGLQEMLTPLLGTGAAASHRPEQHSQRIALVLITRQGRGAGALYCCTLWTTSRAQLENTSRNIEIVGADPVTRHGFTQVPNFILTNKNLSVGAKLAYAMLLKYAWTDDALLSGPAEARRRHGLRGAQRAHLSEGTRGRRVP